MIFSLLTATILLVKVNVSLSALETSHRELNALQDKVKVLQEKVEELTRKVDVDYEYCGTLPEGICGPCRCRDDRRILRKYYCDCQSLQPKRDCLEFYQSGVQIDGVYQIHQNQLKIIQVFCDMTTDGGGWTVVQRRVDGAVKFYRDWANYKVGFGDLQHEFWLGNENLFTMTLQALYPRGSELRIDLEDWAGEKRYAKYGGFQVGNEQTKYELHIIDYSGNVGGNEMAEHNGRPFTTLDADNDDWVNNCAIAYKGGWWYDSCHHMNLNGKYYDLGEMGAGATGIHSYYFHGHNYPLKHSEMKMRRVQ